MESAVDVDEEDATHSLKSDAVTRSIPGGVLACIWVKVNMSLCYLLVRVIVYSAERTFVSSCNGQSPDDSPPTNLELTF